MGKEYIPTAIMSLFVTWVHYEISLCYDWIYIAVLFGFHPFHR